MLFSGELLWITSLTGIKRLIGGFYFDWFLIGAFSLCDRRAKEFEVSKYFVNC